MEDLPRSGGVEKSSKTSLLGLIAEYSTHVTGKVLGVGSGFFFAHRDVI